MAIHDAHEPRLSPSLGAVEAEEVARWLPIVKRLARQTYKSAPRGELLDDLEGDGFEALLRALDSFDPVNGGTLASWITLKVRGAMVDGLRRRHPGPYRRRQERERLGSVKFVSLDAPVRFADTGAPLTFAETLADLDAVPVADQVEEREQLAEKRRRVRQALDKLSQREKRIMVLRHVEELSVAEVAARERVTESRIYEIERVARVRAGGASAHDLHGLSDPELEVLQYTAAGDTARDTAKRLRRSVDTVKVHRKAAIAKLKARNMYHAISKAYRLGILR